jgi:Flp pilus assembly protein TadD
MNPKDSNLCLAMGVLAFIQRDFKEAKIHFQNGIRENPTDHTLWNKYGAALANNLEVEEAIKVYQTALDLRPNYVRTMANIGLAYRTLTRFEESVPYFLNALVLNPHASSVWRYIRSSFLQMNRMDAVEKLNLKDPNVFRSEFPMITRDQLPKPNLERLY